MSVAGGMGTNFDAPPPRIRYRPLSKAIWAALMLDVGMLRVFVARATNPTDGSLAGLLEALDMVAARRVLAAIGGDTRAVRHRGADHSQARHRPSP